MTNEHDRRPVLVIAHRVDHARAIQQRLDRTPLRATVATLGTDGRIGVDLEPRTTVVLCVPRGTCPAWEVVAGLRGRPSDPVVVVVAEEPDGPVADLCLLAGARTVLDASDADRVLAAAIDRTRRGGCAGAEIRSRRRRALQRLVAGGTPSASGGVRISGLEPVPGAGTTTVREHRLLDQLGPAQQAVVAGVLQGATVPEIAAARGVSRSAAYAARQRLATRLGVSDDLVDEEIVRRFGN